MNPKKPRLEENPSEPPVVDDNKQADDAPNCDAANNATTLPPTAPAKEVVASPPALSVETPPAPKTDEERVKIGASFFKKDNVPSTSVTPAPSGFVFGTNLRDKVIGVEESGEKEDAGATDIRNGVFRFTGSW